MADGVGRGAQVRLDGEQQRAVRGVGAATLWGNLEAKRSLEHSGAVSTGYTPDGSSPLGVPPEEEVLVPFGEEPEPEPEPVPGQNIRGTAGADTLTGGVGDDTLTTSSGRDSIGFVPGDGDDVVTYFAPGLDTLWLGMGDVAPVLAAATRGGVARTLVTFEGDDGSVFLAGATGLSADTVKA